MQNARDTFYVTLRDRLAVLNPARTTVVRSLSRPGVLVVENELVSASLPPDVFCIRWTELGITVNGPMPLVKSICEIQYATAGSEGGAGTDRGRYLAEMDLEVSTVLGMQPQNLLKWNYSKSPSSAMLTRLFWSDLTFKPAVAAGERIVRTALVNVFCYQEAGEL